MKSRSIFIGFMLSIIALFTSGCRGADGAFGPIFPTPTQIGVVSRPPVPVNFETLNADPLVFVDRFVRVSGRYKSLDEIVCSSRRRGPSIDWHLISDGFEMNMSGFGSVVDIAPDQVFFTLDGIWRQYEGPVGCAKEPKEKTVWYLEVVRIVDPNPIIANRNGSSGIGITPSTSDIGDSGSTPTAEPQDESQLDDPADDSSSITSTPTINLTRNSVDATNTPILTATPTALLVTTPGSPTPTATITTSNGTPTTTTSTPTPTLASSSEATISPTPTVNGGLGGTGSGTPNPATPVPTPSGGYPGSDPATPVGGYP